MRGEEETEEESRRWKEPREALLLERERSVLSPLAVVSPYQKLVGCYRVIAQCTLTQECFLVSKEG